MRPTVQVNEANQKFFVKVFQKGLQAGPFNESLALSRPASMTEIRARAEKHVEAEEDKEDRLQAEKETPSVGKKITPGTQTQAVVSHQAAPAKKVCVEKYTMLRATRAQILKEVYHLRLLDIPPPTKRQLGPSREEWCEFHRT
ncbi:hypothetical protein CR513_47524, partial [Mucuna pruriens]